MNPEDSNQTEKTKNEKWDALIGRLENLGSAAVALSGGVDSSLLAVAARQALGARMLAVTIRSEVETNPLMDLAADLAARFDFPHQFLDVRKLDDPAFTANSPERCYVCKNVDLGLIGEVAQVHGLAYVLIGANADDQADYRPGLRAAAEHQVLSPLADVHLSKPEIRSLAREQGLPNWNLPSSPCLASRIPYGSTVTREKLEQILHGEEYLHGRGFPIARVRHNGSTVKIEVPAADLPRLLDGREELVAAFKQLGFKYVTVDLEGYRTGSLNEVLNIG